MDINTNKIIEDLKENNGHQEVSETDLKLYDLLYSNLDKENTNGFSLGFSKNIVRKIEAKQQRRFNIKMYCLSFVLLLISIPFFIGFLDKDFIFLLFSTFMKYKFVIVFLLMSIVFIQFSDKLIRSKDI